MKPLSFVRGGGNALVMTIALVSVQPAGTTGLTIASAKSRASIDVGKAGAFSFAGHTHRVEVPGIAGTIALDPAAPERSRVRIEIDATRLTVVRTDESEKDIAEIQRTMLSDRVLDTARFPTIAFQSVSVAVRARRGTTFDLTVEGDLTIHGETRRVAAPVHVDLASGAVTAAGRFEVRQSDYGIKPVTVGGVVKVKDTLGIDFAIVAEATRSSSGEARSEIA